MLLVRGQISPKTMAFYVPIGCVRFASYYGEMYSRHLYPFGGLGLKLETVVNDVGCTLYNDDTVCNVIIKYISSS